MDERSPDHDPDPPPGTGLPAAALAGLTEALTGATRALFLTEAARMQTMLLLWDAVVLDETERGLVVDPRGRAERAFVGHLSGALRVSTNRAATVLHAAVTARGLEVSFGLFTTGAFGWDAMECVVRNLGALSGDARKRYDLEAARLAAETVPQLLETALSRLHDQLDTDDATETAARERRVRARPGSLGAATLTLTGPQTDVAAIYETAHRLAVAAHGVEGETRSMDQLRYDCTVDVILHGFAAPPAELGGTGTDEAAAEGHHRRHPGHRARADGRGGVGPARPAPRVGLPLGRRGSSSRGGGPVLDQSGDGSRRRRDPRLRQPPARDPDRAAQADLDALGDLRRARMPRRRTPRGLGPRSRYRRGAKRRDGRATGTTT